MGKILIEEDENMKIKTAKQMHNAIKKDIERFMDRLEKKYYSQPVLIKVDDEWDVGRVSGISQGRCMPIETFLNFDVDIQAKILVDDRGNRHWTGYLIYNPEEDEGN